MTGAIIASSESAGTPSTKLNYQNALRVNDDSIMKTKCIPEMPVVSGIPPSQAFVCMIKDQVPHVLSAAENLPVLPHRLEKTKPQPQVHQSLSHTQMELSWVPEQNNSWQRRIYEQVELTLATQQSQHRPLPEAIEPKGVAQPVSRRKLLPEAIEPKGVAQMTATSVPPQLIPQQPPCTDEPHQRQTLVATTHERHRQQTPVRTTTSSSSRPDTSTGSSNRRSGTACRRAICR